MKKILLLLTIFFASITLVNAKDIVQEVNKVRGINCDDFVWTGRHIWDNIKTKDGYIIYDKSTESINTLILYKIQKDNKLEWKKEIVLDEFINIGMDQTDHIYINDHEILLVSDNSVLLIDTTDGTLKKSNYNFNNANKIQKFNNNYLVISSKIIYLIDSDLNILKEYNFENNFITYTTEENKIYAFTESSTTDEDGVTHYFYNIQTLNSDLEVESTKTYETENAEYSIGQGDMIKIDDVFYIESQTINKFNPDGTIEYLRGVAGPSEVGEAEYSSLKKIADYYFAVGFKLDEGKTYGFVEILDKELNVIETINVLDSYNLSSENYFSMAKSIDVIEDGFTIGGFYRNISSEEKTEDGFILEYAFVHNIETKTDGKGTIEVIEQSKSGDSITFKVTPEKGYVLGTAKVTDANGNTVTFTDYTFTMPNVDVTIQVTFIPETPENPDTTDTAIIACVLIIICGITGTIYSINKIRWINE